MVARYEMRIIKRLSEADRKGRLKKELRSLYGVNIYCTRDIIHLNKYIAYSKLNVRKRGD